MAWPLPAGSWAATLPPPNVGQTATATIETPTTLPLAQRVAMQPAAITAAVDTLVLADDAGGAPRGGPDVLPAGRPRARSRTPGNDQ